MKQKKEPNPISLIEQQLVQLLRISISGISEPLISKVDWTEMMHYSSRQGVLGVAFGAIEHLRDEDRPHIDFIMDWMRQVTYLESIGQKHKDVIADLASLLHTNNIRMLLLKGYGLSLSWPKPALRPMGDIDIYTFGKWKEFDKLMHDTLGISICTSHHKHSELTYKGKIVENHYDFLNVHAHKSTAEIERILLDELNAYPDKEIPNLYYPSARFNALYLLRHSGEHFASVEMQLRHVLDWAFFVQKNKVDWEWLLLTLDRVGMKTYLAVLNAICIRHLGFPSDIFPDLPADDALVDRSLNDILHPEVKRKHKYNPIREVVFRFQRWWKNGWKNEMVYRESRWQLIITQMWSHILKPTWHVDS